MYSVFLVWNSFVGLLWFRKSLLLLTFHSPKSIASGMLGIVEISKMQSGVSGNQATVSGGDAEFIE